VLHALAEAGDFADPEDPREAVPPRRPDPAQPH